MSWLEVSGIVGLLLAIGAALDFVVRPAAKRNVAALILRVTTKGSQYAYSGTKVLDRIFGEGLLSFRAISRYALISIISISVSYYFAWATTPHVPESEVPLFPGKWGSIDVLILSICIAFAILGDVASYSITRVFVRAVDNHKNAVVATGLVVADFISSLFLFFFTFSLSRVFCYLIVLYSSGSATVTSTTTYLPEMVREGIGSSRISIASDHANWTSQYVQMVAQIQGAKLQEFARWVRDSELGDLAGRTKFDFIRYEAKLSCVDTPVTYQNVIGLVSDSASLLDLYAKENSDKGFDSAALSMTWSKRLLSNKKPCLTKELTITREMPAGGIIGVAGPADTYLAAAERTLYDAYQLMGFKLAPYISFNPQRSLHEYAISISQMESISFLGMSESDPSREMVSKIYAQTLKSQKGGGVNVPFSPMVASSLASSLGFLLYLVSLAIAWVAERLRRLIGGLVPKLDLDLAPFTIVGLAISSIYMTGHLLGRLSELVWTWLFI